ncbi:MAG: tetratricopeptide repeat protein [Planctomycetes bacterium]|nr:tetratricopeptide repeat protein [Planctomycetota bacterium]
MDDSPISRMTFRQAISRQWQIPLFLLSAAAFGAVLWQLRPEPEEEITFEQRLANLQVLAQENRYSEFYQKTELLRLQTVNDDQLGQVHALAGKTRFKEISQRHEFEIDRPQKRSAEANYQKIIADYGEALKRNQPSPDSPESRGIYHDVALSYWCMNDTERAFDFMNKAIEVDQTFNPLLHRNLVQMNFLARPEGYLETSMEHLELLLAQEESSVDDKAWAFLRKTEVLLGQVQEEKALALLENADDAIRESQYGDELEYLRGRALHQIGQTDQADHILRELFARLTERGDTYAQTVIELGKISYEQYRDQDAQRFFQLVVDSQVGKDWYVVGRWGVAQATLLQQRYGEAFGHYQEAIDLIKKHPNNRAITAEEIQRSLAIWSQEYRMSRQYDLALTLLELEQQLASDTDIYAANRYALILARRAAQLQEQVQQSENAADSEEISMQEEQWLLQKRQQITSLFGRAAEQYLRVASLVVGDDKLYGDSLWEGAICYDKAGNVEKTIEAWQTFVAVREGEPEWPRALFNLAQSNQSIDEIEAAINYYEMLLSKHPTSMAAFDAVVPLAHCFLAKEPQERDRAEILLKSILQDAAINPPSPYFRDALFELGELYYESENYSGAIEKLTEAVDRYPQDHQLGKSKYLVGDSYRRSGLALDTILTDLNNDPTASVRWQKTSGQRQQYLENAREYFDGAIGFYTEIPESRRSDLDEMYMRHSWLYRADCLYDLERYQEAADLYELVVLRYQLTPTALAALVQIVNCHLKLGDPSKARSANRRAMYQLDNMPEEAIVKSSTKLTRTQWQDWFDRTERSNLW